jgi:hypothetical protein
MKIKTKLKAGTELLMNDLIKGTSYEDNWRVQR